jgi:predicted lactoylglutathione lyase
MIAYITLGTNDLPRAAAFYDALLGELGIQRMASFERGVHWGASMTAPGLAVMKPFDGQAASVGNGVMVALTVDTPAKVDALYAKALSLGATDEGAPGPRGDLFYCAYFRDLDGNKLNLFCLR